MVHCVGWCGRGARLRGNSSTVRTGLNSVVYVRSPSGTHGIGAATKGAAGDGAASRVRRRGDGVLVGAVALRDIRNSFEKEVRSPTPIGVADGARLAYRSKAPASSKAPAHRPP